MTTQNKIELIQKHRKNALAIVHRVKGVEIKTEYYLFGRQVGLHRFKQKIKHLPPFEIVVSEE